MRCRVCKRKLKTTNAKKRGIGGGCLRMLLKEKLRIEARLFEIDCIINKKNHNKISLKAS
jgi:hypothetical protein